MKPNPDTFGPGVRKLNPQLFKENIPHGFHMSKDGTHFIGNDWEEVPTVKESLSVRSTEESSAVQAKDEIKSEKQLQEQIAALLRNRGIVVQRSRMDRKTTGTVGIPDFLFAIRTPGCQWGRPIAFEVKMPGKNLTPEQSDCMSAMRSNGWDARIIRSVDEALKALNEMGARELI